MKWIVAEAMRYGLLPLGRSGLKRCAPVVPDFNAVVSFRLEGVD